MPSSREPTALVIGPGRAPASTVTASAQTFQSTSGSGGGIPEGLTRSIAVMSKIQDAPEYTAGSSETSRVLNDPANQVWVGSDGSDNVKNLFKVVVSSDNHAEIEPLLDADGVIIEVIDIDGVNVGDGFVDAGDVTCDFSSPIPEGTDYKILYGISSTLSTMRLDALSQIGKSSALEKSLEDVNRTVQGLTRLRTVQEGLIINSILGAVEIGDNAPYGLVEEAFGNTGPVYGFKAATGTVADRPHLGLGAAFANQAYPVGITPTLTVPVITLSTPENTSNASGYAIVQDKFFSISGSSLSPSGGEAIGITVDGIRVLHLKSPNFIIGGSSGGAPAIVRRTGSNTFVAATIGGTPGGSSPQRVKSIAFDGEDTFVALIEDAGTDEDILVSTDGGLNWTYHSINATGTFQSIDYDDENDLWVLMVSNTGAIYNAKDPTGTWQTEDNHGTGAKDFLCIGSARLVVQSTGRLFYYFKRSSVEGSDDASPTTFSGFESLDRVMALNSRVALISTTADSWVTGVILRTSE